MDLSGPLVSHYKVKGIAKSDLDPFVNMSFELENATVDQGKEIAGPHMSPTHPSPKQRRRHRAIDGCRITGLSRRGVVTPQTQKGSKHEKYNPKVLIDFSFLTIQSK